MSAAQADNETTWATSPLLDPANVGRYVWVVWNSNIKLAQRTTITKIGRTNIHLASGESCRVNMDGSSASGTRNGYSVSCHTEAHRLDRDERMELVNRLNRIKWGSLPIDLLRGVADLVYTPTPSVTDSVTADVPPTRTSEPPQ